MTTVDDIQVGWLVNETLPPAADYTPRGGYVVGVSGTDEAPMFATLDLWRGQFKSFDLSASQIDLGTAIRPSLQTPGGLESLIKAILAEAAKEKGKKFSGHTRWLIDVAYNLLQKVP